MCYKCQIYTEFEDLVQKQIVKYLIDNFYIAYTLNKNPFGYTELNKM